MNVQIDETILVASVATASVSIIAAILVGVWWLLDAFRQDFRGRIAAVDKGLEDRQNAWREMLEVHILAETKEFESLHQLKAEVKKLRENFLAGYATKREVSEQLARMSASIEDIRRIVDARTRTGADPVSGRPAEERRMAQ